MTKLVENEIGPELQAAGRGSILYDGWSKNGAHYVAIYGCYMKNVK